MPNKSLTPRFLLVNQIKLLNKFIEGPTNSRLRSETLLESAVNSPINQQHYAGENDPFRLAAALSYKLNKNHAFANGNKRTALLAASLFLLQNGRELQRDASQEKNNDGMVRVHDDVAMGTVDESGLTEIFRKMWQTTSNDGEEVHEGWFSGFTMVRGNVEHVLRAS